MAIQFPCGACGQAVEIDDEWGGKTVACPFCHSRIIAPTESRLTGADDVPMATAAQSPPRFPPPQFPPPEVMAPPRPVAVAGSNRLAIVAVVLAGVLLVLLISFNRVISAHAAQVQAATALLEKAIDDGRGFFVAAQKASQSFMDPDTGSVPGWVMAIAALEFSAMFVWMAAVICGIIAVLRPQNRRYSIASLVVCGLTPVLFCCLGAAG